MKRPLWPQKYLLMFAFSSFLFSCGIEQYYYLPQLSQANIQLTSNNSATVIIPSIAQYYYATNYSIFYRIYISNVYIPIIDKSSGTLTSINASLNSDYNAIFPYIDPTNTTAAAAINTLFKGRNYFELELSGADINDNILSTRGGTLRLEFNNVDHPYSHIIFNNGSPITMKRSGELISPVPDFTFTNSDDLNNYTNANTNVNADVSSIPNSSSLRYAYVSMYIVAVGMNSELFTAIYSKPTHIGIFLLPDR